MTNMNEDHSTNYVQPQPATGGQGSSFTPAFAGLEQQKRSGDRVAAHRNSMSDQAANDSFLSRAFHKYLGRNPR